MFRGNSCLSPLPKSREINDFLQAERSLIDKHDNIFAALQESWTRRNLRRNYYFDPHSFPTKTLPTPTNIHPRIKKQAILITSGEIIIMVRKCLISWSKRIIHKHRPWKMPTTSLWVNPMLIALYGTRIFLKNLLLSTNHPNRIRIRKHLVSHKHIYEQNHKNHINFKINGTTTTKKNIIGLTLKQKPTIRILKHPKL